MENFRILFFTQANYGERIVMNVRKGAPPSWSLRKIDLPRDLPELIDNPEELIGEILPSGELECELLLFLGESPSAFSLLPDILEKVSAKAVIAPADDYDWLPLGLERQIRAGLRDRSIPTVFPKPFCSLAETGDPVIDEFVRLFGRPRFRIDVREGVVEAVEVLRGAPCGSTRYMAEKLVGTPVEEAPARASLLVQTYPCLASRKIERLIDDSLVHVSGQIIYKAVEEALRQQRTYKR